MKPIHPFPARMASSIALNAIADLPEGSRILDPMIGSGTVLREAVVKGHEAYGYDLDPLAVLISKVWTTPTSPTLVQSHFERLIKDVSSSKLRDISLPWIDEDIETGNFIEFWFGSSQRNELRKISYFLEQYRQAGVNTKVLNALKLALSRIIITKKVGASLAWDIPHSRPHKVKNENEYSVLAGYGKSVERLLKQLTSKEELKGTATIRRGDARNLKSVEDGSIDAVVTSPPYLNAIDYLRGHKFSLVWFGHKISDIRKIRSISIGAERGRTDSRSLKQIANIRDRILSKNSAISPQMAMIDRYIGDAIAFMSEVRRVLSPSGKAVMVVGNSCLRGVYIRNSEIFRQAGELSGLQLRHSSKRMLPTSSRHLPTPKGKADPLGKRMKYEIVQTFSH